MPLLVSPEAGRVFSLLEGNEVLKPVSHAEAKWPPVVSKRQALQGGFEKYWNGILQLWTYTILPFLKELFFFFF